MHHRTDILCQIGQSFLRFVISCASSNVQRAVTLRYLRKAFGAACTDDLLLRFELLGDPETYIGCACNHAGLGVLRNVFGQRRGGRWCCKEILLVAHEQIRARNLTQQRNGFFGIGGKSILQIVTGFQPSINDRPIAGAAAEVSGYGRCHIFARYLVLGVTKGEE